MSRNTLAGLRDRYGPFYIIRFPDIDIPWKLLSIGDFLRYDSDSTLGAVPQYILQEEIFKKSVLDNSVLNNPKLLAGVVPVVATTVMSASGPQGIEQFNEDLDFARHVTQNIPIHTLVVLICRAFPAYKPEDVYNMEYPDFMLRLAQAESSLLEAGVLEEPIKLYSKEELAKKVGKKRVDPQKLKEAWEAQKNIPATPSMLLNPQPSADKGSSNVVRAWKRGEHFLNTREMNKEIAEIRDGTGGWDRSTMETDRVKLAQEAASIYGDVMKQLPAYKNTGSTDTAQSVSNKPKKQNRRRVLP